MTANLLPPSGGVLQRKQCALSREPYQSRLVQKPVRDDVVFRRASSSRLAIRVERVNSLSTLRDVPPRLHVKRFQKTVSAVLHLALRKARPVWRAEGCISSNS
jgi:hypothetical protein